MKRQTKKLNKDIVVSFRVNLAEREMLEALSSSKNLKEGEYVRALIREEHIAFVRKNQLAEKKDGR